MINEDEEPVFISQNNSTSNLDLLLNSMAEISYVRTSKVYFFKCTGVEAIQSNW
jgi:hypothetical protein